MVYDLRKREEDISQIITLFHKGLTEHMILKYLCSTRGWKRSDAVRLIDAARQVLLLRLKRAKDLIKAESLAFYEGVCASKDASYTEKIKARERIDKLLGLEEQTVHVEHDVRHHHVVDLEKLNLDLDTAKKLLEAVREMKEHESGTGQEDIATSGPIIDVEEVKGQ